MRSFDGKENQMECKFLQGEDLQNALPAPDRYPVMHLRKYQ